MRTLIAGFLSMSLVLVPRATAQADPKQVLADFKGSSKLEVKACKTALAGLAADLQHDFDVLELGFDELSSDDAPIELFAFALIEYQDLAHKAVTSACINIGDAAGEALALLTPGPSDGNIFPTGLVSGDGGALDDAIAQVEQAAEKAATAVAKKLAKLSKSLRKKTNMRLAVVLQPQPAYRIAPIPGGFNSSTPSSLDIDLLVGFNRGVVNDDGRVWASGFAEFTGGDVTVMVHGPTNVTGTASTYPSPDRWFFESDVRVKPLFEGSYMVFAQQSAAAYVGVPLGLL